MKTSKKIFTAAAAFTTAITLSAAASATIFDIDYNDAGVWTAYDTDNQAYAMKYRSDQGKDGFWLVVTDGDNPKGDGQSHAILYGDLINNRITAYTYSGENNSESFQSGTFLGSYENAFSAGGKHPTYGYDMTMFSLDVGDINNAIGGDFEGISIGEKAGIWFHQSSGSEFTYGEDGSIVDYAFDNQMWLDRGNDATKFRGAVNCETGEITGPGAQTFINPCGSTQIAGAPVGTSSGGGSVPAPGGLALVLVGLIGLGRKLRSTKA